MEPISVYGLVRFGKSMEGNVARSAARNARDVFFENLKRVAFGVLFEFLAVSVFNKLANGAYELNDGRAKEIFEGF